jgi:hypothetical protein
LEDSSPWTVENFRFQKRETQDPEVKEVEELKDPREEIRRR